MAIKKTLEPKVSRSNFEATHSPPEALMGVVALPANGVPSAATKTTLLLAPELLNVRIPDPLDVNLALVMARVPLYTVATPLVPNPLSTEPSAFSRTRFTEYDEA